MLGIVRDRHAAFAGGQMLDRMKGEAGNIGQGAGRAALVGGAGRMAGIGDDPDAARLGQRAERIIIGGLAGIIHRHDGLGAWRDAGGDRCRIDQQRVWLDIGKDRLGAFIERGIGGGGEGDAPARSLRRRAARRWRAWRNAAPRCRN